MTCKRIQTQLADYSAQRLAPPEAEEVRRHLDGCNACDRLLREEATLAVQLERLSFAEPRADLWAAVAAGLDAPQQRSGLWERLTPWTGRKSVAALLTGLAATAGFLVYTQQPVSSPTIVTNPPPAATEEIYIPIPSQNVNPDVDDPLAEGTDNLLAALDRYTQAGATD